MRVGVFLLLYIASFAIEVNAAMRSDIAFSGTGVVVSCHWSAGDVAHGYVEAATATNLDAEAWEYLQSWSVGTNEEMLSVSSPLSISGQQFWRFCSWSDEDGDGLSQEQELSLFHTDPRLSDTDGDGLPDDFEVALGMDPLTEDYSYAPKMTVGTGGAYATLTAAIAASSTNAVIEIQPGVYNWANVDLPDYPIMITTPDAGRDRRVVLRSSSSGSYVLGVHGGARSVIRGLYFDLSESSVLAGVWVGGSLPWSGLAGSVRIENCYFQLSQVTRSYGVNVYRYSPKLLVISSCVFNAIDSFAARGVNLYDSNPVVVDHCSFLNFPAWTDENNSWGVSYCSSLTHLSDNSTFIPMVVKSTLFDNSFTNALPLALISGSGLYDVRLCDCVLPSTNVLVWAEQTSSTNLFVGAVGVSAYGLLSDDSAAVNAGGPVSQGEFDIKGEPRDEDPDIGAVECITDSDPDTDADGLANSIETILGTNPFVDDTDKDGVDDGLEYAHGSMATNRNVVCFNLNASVTNPVPRYVDLRCALVTTNAVGWSLVSEEVSVSNEVSTVYDGHLIWDVTRPLWLAGKIADSDGTWQGSALCITQQVKAASHAVSVGGVLPTALWDADSDDMADGWEVENGLTPTNSVDAFENPDGDGLINLHEYWASCDPHTPDGSNTVLSVMAQSIDSLLANDTVGHSACIYSGYSSSIFESNNVALAQTWSQPIDLSCESPLNGWHGVCESGTLLTRRHVLFARHYLFQFGEGSGDNWRKIYFRGRSGTVYARHVVATNTSERTDFKVALLDEDLPDDVSPARVLPRSYARYIRTGTGLPMLTLDYQEKSLVHDIIKLPEQPGNVNCRFPTNSVRSAYTEPIIVGDSGNPRFLIVTNTPVLVSTLWYGPNSAAGGPFVTSWYNELQQLIDELSVDAMLNTNLYQLIEFDLSPYQELENR